MNGPKIYFTIPLLGGIDNKMPANNDLSQPLVHIKHFNVLGGTDVMTRVHKNA